MKRIEVGSTVTYRLYNTPEGKFYGPKHTATVTEINRAAPRPFTVARADGQKIALSRKEIKSVK